MKRSEESLEALWAYCTADNRLVPMPGEWKELFEMLENKRRKPAGGWEPPLPLILAAWHDTMPVEKQLRFKEHLQWAETQDQLDQVGAFLRGLSEEDDEGYKLIQFGAIVGPEDGNVRRENRPLGGVGFGAQSVALIHRIA